MKYHLIHLGCQMNQSDAERITSVLHAMGYSPTDSEEDANLLGIVACSVRQKAIDKVYSKIQKWNTWKNRKNLLTFVSGCILPSDREKFLERFDLLFSINELPELPQMISQYGVVTPGALDPQRMQKAQEIAQHNANQSPASPPRPVGPMWLKDPKPAGLAFTENPLPVTIKQKTPEHTEAVRKSTLHSIRALQDELKSLGGAESIRRTLIQKNPQEDPMGGFWFIEPSYSSDFEAFIPIQNGCDKFCSFCAVPYTRGREVSRPSREILSEVQTLVDRGYKSITLLGQNVNSYGLDKPGQELSFPQLMEEIGKIGDRASQEGREFWTYFTSPHPRDMTDELLHVIAKYPCLAKQIHLPLQSGDDKVLFKMNRNHSMARYRSIVTNIREILPEATIFTDIIVGFTSETDQQFENTRQAVREFKYNMAFIAMYSPRPGAASSRWDDDISQDEKKRRLHLLSQDLQEVSLEYNRQLVGKTLRVLVEKSDRKSGYLSGRTEGKIGVRFPSSDSELIGQFVDLTITSCQALSLEGQLTDSRVTAL